MDDKSMIEREQILIVLNRYMHAVDSLNRPLLQSCFAPDATGLFRAGTPHATPLADGATIVAYIADRLAAYVSTIHSMSNVDIRIEGDRAYADMRSTSHVVIGNRMNVRGNRLTDELERRSGNWMITKRIQAPLWSFWADLE